MQDYLHVSSVADLPNRYDRWMYRFLEIMPGFLALSTLVAVVIFSFLIPAYVSIFIILFDVYWLLKAVYVSLHLRSTYKKMGENLKVDWLRRLGELPRIGALTSIIPDGVSEPAQDWRDIYHVVILPMATEPYEVVRESFRELANIEYPLGKLIVVLAIEEWMGDSAREIAKRIGDEFGGKFNRFLVSIHPDGLSGEMRGKGANAAWAGKMVTRDVIDVLDIAYEHVLVSSFDIDTAVPRQFFGRLTHAYLTCEKPLRSSFQPLPIFSNNIWEAPAFARVFAFSTTFWQMIQQARPERLVTFSSQSLSLQALVDVGFWQTNMVSEDSRIFWQCFLRYNGDWRTVPLAFPVYMDANVAPTFWQTLKNQYKQIRRWAWGVENNPYFLFGFLKNKKIPFWQKWDVGTFMIESTHSLATNSILIFLLGWLPVVVGGSVFNTTILSYNLPHITRNIMNVAMIGLVSSAIIAINLLPPRPPKYGRFKYIWMALQWILFPVNVIFFGCIPALEAQTRLMLGGKYRLGFWVTPKSRASGAGNQS